MSGDLMSQLWIVITDFNGYAQTRRCLSALRASHHQAINVVVVDHGTSEETRAGLEREFPAVTRLTASPDLWWAGASNVGIRHALAQGAETVMLLNNDCYVMPDTIGTLMALWRAYPGAIIAPLQRDLHSGEMTCIRPRCLFGLGFPTIPGPRRLTQAMQASPLLPVELIIGGRGTVIAAAIFKQIGLFDEATLPHYGADHDFYLRARESNIPLYMATRAIVDIDTDRTSMASNAGRLNFSEFLESLRNTGSHRNVAHVAALFKKHYPYKRLYGLGVALYLGRYFAVYLMRRFWFLLRSKP